jgi:MEMO1 family protein
VAGRFYPADADTLQDEVDTYLSLTGPPPVRAIGVVAPHAGYVYSGGVAGQVYARIQIPARVVILSPNHTGHGPPVAVVASGAFRVPGADVPIDEPLAAAILREVPGAVDDVRPHAREHAVEVHLPFLLARRTDVRIVPIVLGSLNENEAVAVGEGIARAVADAHDVLVVASSDMSHYLPDDVTRERDKLAITPMLALDPRALYRAVTENEISMCGYLPATAMLSYARERNATQARLAAYATSGDAFGDRKSVVGYAGIIVQ